MKYDLKYETPVSYFVEIQKDNHNYLSSQNVTIYFTHDSIL